MEVLSMYFFFYGEHRVEHRRIVWEQLQWFLEEFKNVQTIGDFNQVESGSDKLGGSVQIRGIDWRFSSNVTKVPFSGPRLTWSNKRDGNELILERLDRAYIKEDWFNHSPDGRITHEPIICSDHAAITYYNKARSSSSNRPYQIENWCLGFPENKEILKDSWKEEIQRSHMFQLFEEAGEVEDQTPILEGEKYIQRINLLILESQLSFNFWKQRMKANWVRFGDCPTPTMYRKVKQRQLKNEILTLRGENDTWVEEQKEIKEVILTSIKDIYNPVTSDNHGEDIDLLLRQLDIPSLLEENRLWLDRAFIDGEIKKSYV
ncbi:uncharacterized protein LOC110734101 [Chenopodium quinoa]|uniref:uncharacterized protein LOC110734101 n=1 Tax=Chenopodium quinoa TaxID=63459 RepID=UPI000B79A55C|nr:uncharacterized protein LOC110734101 [Chenopodium quinoa]